MQSLNEIQSPKDLKALSIDELKNLSVLIKERIIDVMSKNGGHLASNLGSLELSIALHVVFDSPFDKLLFDTSHQAYTHKILTGRNARFETIRKYQGLSGFTSPDESPHDHFFAGHAGTALSLALGVAKARDLSCENFHVLPVIGDAAFTCGLTLEALNNIPKDLSRFLIILNDNGMSISQNVGAITDILKSKDLKNLFKHYHLEYLGPYDGHNLDEIITVLRHVKDRPKPVILHLLTQKGHGMAQAAHDPVCYHGVKPFDKETGTSQSSSATTFPKLFGQIALELSHHHEQLVTLTPAMAVGSSLVELMKTYPNRCLDVGIAEGHCVTFAGGIARDRSKKVLVSIYATFLQRALDNLFQDVCLQNAPVIFALDRAGLAGGDGATHNGIYDIGFLKGMPNLMIAQPRDGSVLRDLLFSAIEYDQPIVIRYPNLPTELRVSPLHQRRIGKGEVLKQGVSIAIIAVGHHVSTAFNVSNILKEEGLDITIVDPIFLKPLDEKLLKNLIETHSLIVTIEEHVLSNGFGEIINSFVASQETRPHVINFGIGETFPEQGSYSELIKEVGLDAKTIAKKIHSCFSVNTACL